MAKLATRLVIQEADGMQRVVYKSKSFQEADENDVRQQLAMTPQERVDAARALQLRVYGCGKDVRESRVVRTFHDIAGRREVDDLRFLEQRAKGATE